MKTSTLCIIWCVLVVGANGLSLLQCTKQLGEKCVANVLCCDGCCEDGICTNSTSCKPTPKTCGELVCQSWQECYHPVVTCKNNRMCYDQPVCRPRQRIGIPKFHNRSLRQTIIDDPCAAVDCVPGLKCQAVTVKCFVAPCPRPRIKCVPTHGTEVPKQLTLPVRETFPDDPCAIIRCKGGEECLVVPIACFVAPCPNPRATCVPKQNMRRF